MSLWEWVLWGVILTAQSSTTTWNTRAKASNNLRYGALASMGSNGVWFCSNLFLVGAAVNARAHGPTAVILTLSFYTLFTTLGTVIAQIIAVRYLERGVLARDSDSARALVQTSQA